MTRTQAESLIKEESLARAEWLKFTNRPGGDFYFVIWFNPNNSKYESVYIGERGSVEYGHAFDTEIEAINDLVKENYRYKYYDNNDIKEYLTKELAQKVIKEENLMVIWYDEPLKPLCAGIKYDKQRDKYISFIIDSKAQIIEWRNIEFDGEVIVSMEKYNYTSTYNDEKLALYALINRARAIKQKRIIFNH